jgi:hypothetical protein
MSRLAINFFLFNLNTVKLGYNELKGTGKIVRYNRGSL